MAQTKIKLIADGIIDENHLKAGHAITTDNIGEGTALYYTDARVQSAGDIRYLQLSGGALTGNLGVGTSPSHLLHLSSASFPNFRIDGGAIQLDSGIDTGGGTAVFGTNSSHPLLFKTNGSEKVRIDSDGNIGVGTSNPAASLDLGSKTDAIAFPKGTTAERPATPEFGMVRFNSDTSGLEVYNGTQWLYVNATDQPYTTEYLVVAGGGGAGGGGGGGGAGGYVTSSEYLLTPGVIYTIVIGAGGSGGGWPNPGTAGQNSVFNNITAIGGGYGSHGDTGGSGGSGGGSGYSNEVTGGSGTSGQGNDGGGGLFVAAGYPGGGGGGAGFDGGDASIDIGGDGGDGLQSSITGTATYYAGGGGGNSRAGTSGTGGLGGGGNGVTNGNGEPGGANTGGGGGSGATTGPGYSGGNGGSGVVILRMLTSNYSGTTTGSPTVTTDGLHTVLKYTNSGSYTA